MEVGERLTIDCSTKKGTKMKKVKTKIKKLIVIKKIE
jgi:hypothetical protein